MSFNKKLNKRLQNLQQQQLYRSRRLVESPQDVTLNINGESLINFCSNDYLGLANHPDVKQAFKNAVDEYGVGSGASQLVTGHQKPHYALEEELADFLGRDRVLLFSTGYMANLGVLSALSERKDEIFEDKLNHASLIDAALLSRAELTRFAHKDVAALKTRLARTNAKTKFVVSDGVFSMDGDKADLVALINITQKNNALLIIDDAHGVGVLGQKGRGIIDEVDIDVSQSELPVLVGTFGKAFGTFGAFVAGGEMLIENLINFSRSYIYTTAMPAAVAEATRASLKIIKQGDERREKLQVRISQFRKGCNELGIPIAAAPEYGSHSAIQPLIVGTADKALNLSKTLQQDGILISAIRPPTVPQNTSRLRITFSANHTVEHVERLLSALSSQLC
ncbi:8-amino-7-oxononanoate synthase [hydrothermal vent metagenome]|uniref:8-amino-7-oxononanoate synthase n=1 Tax=hydrothermal vent metagenome TaxID=652676 RepID=A0A3B0ZXF7_9ZZZZ